MPFFSNIVVDPLVLDLVKFTLGIAASILGKHLPGFISNYNKVTPLLGAPWYVYHWSRTDGEANFRKGTLQCKRTLYGVKVEITNKDGKKSNYRGRVTFENKDILLEFSAKRHSESFHVRMNDPIEHEDTKMVGLVLGIDYDREKYATVQICLRNERSDEDAKILLKNATDYYENESGLRVIKTGDRKRISALTQPADLG